MSAGSHSPPALYLRVGEATVSIFLTDALHLEQLPGSQTGGRLIHPDQGDTKR